LDLLETLLSPALLCLPERPAVITPIQRKFAQALLGDARQVELLPQATALTYRQRHYLSDPRTLSQFRRGTLILFYESGKQGGRGLLIAIARVRQAYLRHSTELASELQQSVLSEDTVDEIGTSDTKAVVVFDNTFHLPSPVPLSTLQRLGCGRPNDLITTRAINDTQLQEILREAYASEA
jgi:hypothetical protein